MRRIPTPLRPGDHSAHAEHWFRFKYIRSHIRGKRNHEAFNAMHYYRCAAWDARGDNRSTVDASS